MKYLLFFVIWWCKGSKDGGTYFINLKEYWVFIDKDAYFYLNKKRVDRIIVHQDSSKLKGIGANLSLPIFEISINQLHEQPYFTNVYCTYTSINYNEERNPESKMGFSNPDQQASFKGGTKELLKYMKGHLKIPEEFKETKGRVFIQFVVELDGTLSDISVIKGINKELNNAAIDMVRNMPPWLAGSYLRLPVRSRYTLAVPFQ